MFKDFLSLVFPKPCYTCGTGLLKAESCLCIRCLYNLPETNFHLQCGNPVEKLFWGRASIWSAASLYEFREGGQVQNLIHQLKYKGKREIGRALGKHYGSILKSAPMFSEIHAVVPVPLHKKSFKKRGYNQSEYFAKGLAEVMNIELANDVLQRISVFESQTKKSRFDRWENVENDFALSHPEKIQGKHILLADDVVTTGATVEACAHQLLKASDVKVSVVSIAAALFN